MVMRAQPRQRNKTKTKKYTFFVKIKSIILQYLYESIFLSRNKFLLIIIFMRKERVASSFGPTRRITIKINVQFGSTLAVTLNFRWFILLLLLWVVVVGHRRQHIVNVYEWLKPQNLSEWAINVAEINVYIVLSEYLACVFFPFLRLSVRQQLDKRFHESVWVCKCARIHSELMLMKCSGDREVSQCFTSIFRLYALELHLLGHSRMAGTQYYCRLFIGRQLRSCKKWKSTRRIKS